MDLKPLFAINVIFLLVLAIECQSARIAMFGFPSAPSHHMVFTKVGKVTVVRTNLDGKHVNLEGLSTYEVVSNVTQEKTDSIILQLSELDPLDGFFKIFTTVIDHCKSKIADPKLLEFLKSCDAIVADPNYMCSSIMSEAAGVPVNVHISPTNFYDPFISAMYGIPISWATVPHMSTKYSPEMTYLQRVHNAFVWLVDYMIRWHYIEPRANELRAQLGLSGSFYKSFHYVSDLIIQTDFALEFPRLITPNVRMVGPILPSPAIPVKDETIRNILDKTENGVVLVSFGTIARLEPWQADIFAKAFGRLKQKVIWKYNGDRPKVEPNTLLVDWIEQNNILGHPNVKAFIAHGGANGILEAAYHGVPIIGLALFADQWDNIMRAQYRGMGILLDKSSLTLETLSDALDKVLNDPFYRENASEISEELRDRDKHPAEESADVIEKAIRRKGVYRHRMAALDLPWYINMGLDVEVTIDAAFPNLSQRYTTLVVSKRTINNSKSLIQQQQTDIIRVNYTSWQMSVLSASLHLFIHRSQP
eukprot:gene5514-7196_t